MREEDFLKIVHENRRIIQKVCHLYRDTKEDREDLFQDILLQLWRSFPDFRNEARISTWMYRIALNTAIAVFRKKKLATGTLEHIPEQSHPNDVSEASAYEERMYEALRKLDTAERAIIALFLEDYSYEEIAVITGITPNYVGVRINRIKKKLKAILN